MKLEDAIKKIEENAKKSEENAKKIENNLEKIREHSGAIAVLHTIKTYNNRFFIMWIITFFALLVSFCYNIYLINDIGTITTQEVEQENNNGNNNFIGGNGDISG